jgi:hypothetical protein
MDYFPLTVIFTTLFILIPSDSVRGGVRMRRTISFSLLGVVSPSIVSAMGI